MIIAILMVPATVGPLHASDAKRRGNAPVVNAT
jgi:hypothetical protein